MKKYEIEALGKSFIIFFTSLTILLSISIYLYYKEEIHKIDDNVKHKMWIYNYNFKNPNFTIDFVNKNRTYKFDKLYKNNKEVYMYFPIKEIDNQYLKIIYPIKIYNSLINNEKEKVINIFILAILILLLFSVAYAYYALYPLKKAINILNEFLKDLIHDLNTPVSSIFINLKLLKRNFNPNILDRIEISVQSISNMYANLEYFIRDIKLDKETIYLDTLLKNRVEYFETIYPHINFSLDLEKFKIYSNEQMIERILDNIISNACKYNKKPYIVKISIQKSMLEINDSGLGIRNPNRVFDRYYKECERGLGIGLHIVKKLCNILNITIRMKSKINIGTTFYLDFTKVRL